MNIRGLTSNDYISDELNKINSTTKVCNFHYNVNEEQNRILLYKSRETYLTAD